MAKYFPVFILTLIFVIVTSLNITKAVHMDDSYYITVAKSITGDFLHPMSGIVGEGGDYTPIYQTFHPIVLQYIYALVIHFFGVSELILHLVISFFSLICILAFYKLAKHFNPKLALFLTAVFAISPAFIPSQNLMLDIPALSLFLLFFLVIITGKYDKYSNKTYFLAATLAGLAPLIKYSGFILIPILFFHIVLNKKWSSLWTVGIPILLQLLWGLWNWYDFGQIHLLSMEKKQIIFDISSIILKLKLWLIGLGSITPFSMIIFPQFFSTKFGKIFITISLLFTLCINLLIWNYPFETLIEKSLRILFFFNALILIGIFFYFLFVHILNSYKKNSLKINSNTTLLVAWFLVINAYLFFITPFIAPRYLLPSLPAILLLIAVFLKEKGISKLSYIGGIFSILLGLMLGISDWVYADIYRTEISTINNYINSVRKNEKLNTEIYYIGAMNFQWYAEKANMKEYLGGKTALNEGDFVAIPRLMLRNQSPVSPKDSHYLKLIKTFPIKSAPFTYLKTVTDWPNSIAGFQGFFWDFQLPWSISSDPLEEFRIYRYEN
ncbi:hypothetical protein A2W14_02800 [Candidatus Gottesmanbacteria bacterium RBG_16_37_8]|uniref:Glycosyltransferase RgtA/B/C/D-like domain-containing protein n=1 Tax=Candidatus Gottesmanbacteria bacterium RBG_16_37_8 TaxID=1798371 RepID=A0A1F5YTQ3_9BACT|nr:MAG: hypothetical protein A2W14_02800 [Candidatus Gottesmanbacteria bacterium RBG_16_37_8]